MAQLKDRLTVVEQVYHQPADEQPDGFESKFSCELHDREQVYQRRTRVGEERKPVDLGWLNRVSMLVISNETGKNLQVQPSKEEKKEMDEKVLEVSFDGCEHGWLILPGHTMRAKPSDISSLRIRCLKGATKYSVVAIPE